ncbi:MAG: hypothetical protein EAZ16_03055 [Sphingobacteriales bacterium]|nr:MAG: hypothetical protein EAZ16_03055 [Sphingobacteriales bacterium]
MVVLVIVFWYQLFYKAGPLLRRTLQQLCRLNTSLTQNTVFTNLKWAAWLSGAPRYKCATQPGPGFLLWLV